MTITSLKERAVVDDRRTETDKVERRAQLAPYVDHRIKCSGVFARHKLIELERKILKTSMFNEITVTDEDGKEFELGHGWVQNTADLDTEHLKLREGDRIEFTALVTPYSRILKNPKPGTIGVADRVTSYNLEWPRDVVVKYRATFMGTVPVVANGVHRVQEELQKVAKGDIVRAVIQALGNELGHPPTGKEVIAAVKVRNHIDVSPTYVHSLLREVLGEVEKVVKPVAVDPPKPPVVAEPPPLPTPVPPAPAPTAAPLDYLGMVKMVRQLVTTLGGKDKLKEFIDLIS